MKIAILSEKRTAEVAKEYLSKMAVDERVEFAIKAYDYPRKNTVTLSKEGTYAGKVGKEMKTIDLLGPCSKLSSFAAVSSRKEADEFSKGAGQAQLVILEEGIFLRHCYVPNNETALRIEEIFGLNITGSSSFPIPIKAIIKKNTMNANIETIMEQFLDHYGDVVFLGGGKINQYLQIYPNPHYIRREETDPFVWPCDKIIYDEPVKEKVIETLGKLGMKRLN